MPTPKTKKLSGAASGRPERRQGSDRRLTQDRRESPRPEGRRKNGGRRAGDPLDA